MPPLTRGLLESQQMVIVPDMQSKIEAQVRGLGCGYLPRMLAGPYVGQGLLEEKATVDSGNAAEHLVYAWRAPVQGEALKWWLKKLESPRLRESLLQAPAVLR
jgi:DNA-binding transcriptional LysR family regulator